MDRDECCELTPVDGVLEFKLGFEVRSVSIIGGFGDLDGLEVLDIIEGLLEDGKEDREALRLTAAAPFEVRVSLRAGAFVPLVVGRWCVGCMSLVPISLVFAFL